MTSLDIRNDLYRTSSGRGHEFKPPQFFPPLLFKRTVPNPLNGALIYDDKVKDFYITTTGTVHDYKPSKVDYGLYKKSPGHWRVNYVEDTIKKISVKPQRKCLTMGNQCSEMKSQFTGSPGLSLKGKYAPTYQSLRSAFLCGSQNLVLTPKEYHKERGIPKDIDINRQPMELEKTKPKLVPLAPSEKGVFGFNGDMYLTTSQKIHRYFTKDEKKKYPQKEYATYWECEEYPKSWGHGSKTNPLPPDSIVKEKPPMRDTTWFKSATIVPRIPKPLQPVPNLGTCSEVAANFRDVPSEYRIQMCVPCSARPCLELGTMKEGGNITKLYDTEYDSIGSGQMVMV